jgi:hypothetical protein
VFFLFCFPLSFFFLPARPLQRKNTHFMSKTLCLQVLRFLM